MKIFSCNKSKQESISIKDGNSSGSPEEAVTGEVRMDVGPIHRKLLAYAAPLLLMQLLLQFYNIADCAVVGRFGGAFGLAAVGVAGLVLAVHINFFIGFGVGVTSAVSRLFGARQYDKLRQAIATSVAIATAAGIFLTLMGELLGKRYLLWLSCPAEAMGDALLYAQICFLGLIPQLVYNVANGVLRALGNTKTPLYFLAGSAVLNVVLDLVLAVGMHCGLEGVAWATVSAQWVLGLAMVWRLTRLDERFCLTADTKLLPMSELFRLLRLGIPSGMQAAFMSISSLLIQISIDGFGPAAMAGMVVYAKIEGFLYYPAFAYGMALTGFIGQNLGSGRLDRVEEAMRISRRTAIYGTMAVCAGLILIAEPLVSFFTGDPATHANALAAVYWTFPFYFLYSLNQVYIGGLKGLGETGIPMFSALFAYALFRVLWCEALLPHWYDMAVIYNAYNVSFLVSLAILIPAYRRLYHRLIASKGEGVSMPEKYRLA